MARPPDAIAYPEIRPVRTRVLGRVIVIASVLGTQAWAIIPFGSEAKEHAWPFVPYSMYASAHAYGEPIVVQRLMARPCAGGPGIVLGAAAVDASTDKQFRALLEVAARPSGTATRARLAAYADRRTPGRWCEFEVQNDSATIAPRGAVVLARRPVAVARWRR
ncbi:hypothetical protein tb265_36620 [Gemmatimonadetes bacterium T265]|nr:hypothetical protein tb265_36620 [Gemmatimonadetes bacterium T265]